MDLDALMQQQHGVVSRGQVLRCGLNDDYIEQQLRHRVWARIHRGIYVDHTGPLTWFQRLWAALLFAWPAVVADESALVLHGLSKPDPLAPVVVAIEERRRVAAPDGTTVRRVSGLPQWTQPARIPARMRVEGAVVRVASSAPDEASAVGVLAAACGSRRTTAARLVETVQRMPRLKRRRLLVQVLEDVAVGACSVLEHRYLNCVERSHGLPAAARQRRVKLGRRVGYRDVEYLGGVLVVELDGRLGHDEAADKWADLERDVESFVGGALTVRVGWHQVLTPCRVALAVARLLWSLGWDGELIPCGSGCTAVVRGRATA